MDTFNQELPFIGLRLVIPEVLPNNLQRKCIILLITQLMNIRFISDLALKI